MNQIQKSELKERILINISKGVQNNIINNEDLIEIIETCSSFLNIRTISDYAKENNISYNGAKNFRQKIKLFNKYFIIDNY